MLGPMKAVDFAVTRILPPDMRQPEYDLSKKGMGVLMAQVASRYPDQYSTIVKKLGDLGRNAAWFGGYSSGASDTEPVIDVDSIIARMDVELAALRKQNLPPDEFEEARNDLYMTYSNMIEKETMGKALHGDNAFAQAVLSGARGNPAHVKAILSSPALYSDAKGRLIPLFVRNSFAKGIRPAELLAGTYGARSAVVSTKKATAKGGDFLKILTQNTSQFNVTDKDCGTDNGLDLAANDDSLLGRVLARPLGDLPAGTVIDRQALARVRKMDKPVIVRSAMTCRARHGLCAKCVGVQSDGKFPRIGESIGITAGDAIGEPIVQGALNVKHSSGMAKGKREFSGFDYISQFVQVPDEFRDRAAVSELDGVVEKIEDAPQGGQFITVSGRRHLALPGFAATVKPGDTVEAGDILSDGLASPADIVRLRGLGEGRKYYMDRLSQILSDSGNPPDRRNMEIVARSTVDNFVIDDPDDDDPWSPDDDVREQDLMASYKPRPDSVTQDVGGAVGGYLQKPVLHYTVGTRVTPKIVNHMKSAGVEKVLSSRTAPGFRAEMPRLRVASHSSRDWLQSLGTSYLSSQMQTALERGDETNVRENYHFGPRLAYGADAGSGAFGENIERTGMF